MSKNKPLPELLDTMPPANLRLEREAISALASGDDRCCGILFTGLRAADFHDAFHRVLFDGLREAWERGHRTNTPGGLTFALSDTGTIGRMRDHLNNADQTDAEAVAIVMASEGCPGNALFYVQSLRQLGQRREVIRAAMALIRDAYDLGKPIGDTLAEAATTLEMTSGSGYVAEPFERRAAG